MTGRTFHTVRIIVLRFCVVASGMFVLSRILPMSSGDSMMSSLTLYCHIEANFDVGFLVFTSELAIINSNHEHVPTKKVDFISVINFLHCALPERLYCNLLKKLVFFFSQPYLTLVKLCYLFYSCYFILDDANKI